MIDEGEGVMFDYASPPLAVPVAPAFPTLTGRQLRLALLAHGVTPDQVDAALAAIPDPHARAVAQIEWGYAETYRREHPLIASIAAILLPDMAPEVLDVAWRAASAI